MYEILYYVSPRGEDFVDEFISSLNNKAVVGRIVAKIDYLKQYGPLAKPPAIEHLGDKLYTLRVPFGRLEIRIFYFFDNKDIILTHGFLKKTPKLPASEIDRAKAIYNAHFR